MSEDEYDRMLRWLVVGFVVFWVLPLVTAIILENVK